MSKQPLIDQLDQAISGIIVNPDVLPSSIDPSVLELLLVARDLRDLPSPDFKTRLRADLERNAGTFHAEVRVGDSMLMIGGGPAYKGTPRQAALHVYVENADEAYRRALEAGAVSLEGMLEDHGDRFGCVKDPAGNEWYISTHLGPHYIPAHLHTVTPYLHPVGAHKLIEFLKQAFGAEELARYDSPEGEVLHAKVRIGDSVVETSEAHGW